MRGAGGWATQADYTQFLSLQHAARLPVETWLAENAPAGLEPPAQCPLIARDLADLGTATPPSLSTFAANAPKPVEALGMAWVLAGSSLGNRSILKEIRRSGHGDWPSAFLGDPAMLAFWQSLRSMLERPATLEEIASATNGANAVFDHFIAQTSAAPL